jgi:type I restriction enzyme S subunit
MSNWELKTLNELGFVGRGKSRHRPRNADILYNGNYPFIQTGDIQKANFYIKEYNQTYSDAGLAQSKLWKNGTMCISIVGANTAETAILGIDACFPDSVIGFVPNETVSDVRFIKYYFDTIKLHLKSIAEGTARENLSLEKLLSFKIPTPKIDIQKKIADTLFNFDTLIENNFKRIKLLEEIIQRTYNEWFVKFNPSLTIKIDKATGLPIGWKNIKIDELVEFINGYAFKSSDYNENGDYKIVTIKNVGDRLFNTNKLDRIEIVPRTMKGNCKIVEGDLLLSLTGNVGRTCIAYGDNLLLNQRVAIIKERDSYLKGYAYALFGDEKIKSLMINLAIGTAQLNLSPVVLSKQLILKPTIEVLKLFNEVVEPQLNQILILHKQNHKLKEARDILLPRLMNGEIEL